MSCFSFLMVLILLFLVLILFLDLFISLSIVFNPPPHMPDCTIPPFSLQFSPQYYIFTTSFCNTQMPASRPSISTAYYVRAHDAECMIRIIQNGIFCAYDMCADRGNGRTYTTHAEKVYADKLFAYG